ncbi:MAG: low specificity L-threonine aldolase [Spirochaetes bacterium]|nr:low specificity L-threonine aldolase [Spirochaetota bacterium]
MKLKRGFASDNNAGIHPDILSAIAGANDGHCIAYGDDPYTAQATRKFKETFGDDIDVYMMFTGTAANVLGLSAIVRPYQAVICSDIAHLNVDECGALEAVGGIKLLTVPAPDGKIVPGQLGRFLAALGDEHHSQPKAISVTETTEVGTVYTQDELLSLSEFAHTNGLFVHMDGARLANAASSLGVGLKSLTKEAGVDVLSFGGTKNGMMLGEAVLFFDRELSKDFKYIRKQGMQLFSKMRYVSAQFTAYLSEDLCLLNARHANRMAKLLASRLEAFRGIEIAHPVEANGVFAVFPEKYLDAAKKEYFFYTWDPMGPVVRLMTSWNTTEGDIDSFMAALKNA